MSAPPANLNRTRTLLLALALLGVAAGPPLPPAEVPAPGPLFNPDEIHANPQLLAVQVIGAAATPRTGAIAAFGIIDAGDRVRAWNLEGAMTTRYGRSVVGAATLILNGHAPGGFAAAVADVGALHTGNQLDCWVLLDTDRFRPLPQEWLDAISDGRPVPEGGLEAEVYAQVQTRAHYTSAEAFRRAARKDVTYTHVFSEPAHYRGVVVRVEGRLLRVNRYRPPQEALEAGVHDRYEAWIFNEQLGANPYCVVFSTWPADLPRDLLGEQKIGRPVRVTVDGYFLKKFRYKSSDRSGSEREAPLVVAHTLIVTANGNPERANSAWVNTLVWGLAGVVFALIAGVVGLTYWYRRIDNRVRQRILRRMPEFALPPPDVPPSAAPAIRSTAPSNRPVVHTNRINFPAGRGGRVNDLPGDGGARSPEKPPDEDAGASPRP